MKYIDAILCRDDLTEELFQKREHDLGQNQILKLVKEFGLYDKSAAMTIIKDKAGKPFVLINGNYATIQVSVAHRFPYIFCSASTRNESLGCDVERVSFFTEELLDSFLTTREKVFLDQEGDKHECAAMIWSCKESFLKAYGSGLLVNPKRVDVLGVIGLTEGEGVVLLDDIHFICKVFRREIIKEHVFFSMSIVRR